MSLQELFFRENQILALKGDSTPRSAAASAMARKSARFSGVRFKPELGKT